MSEPNIEHIMQVGMGFWASKTLLSAVELGLFTELAKQPEDLTSLQKRLGLHPRSSRDFLDALVADDDRSQNAFGLLMSLNMLIETPGGFDYTGADCVGWIKEAGFGETRVEHLLGADSMVVGIK